MSPRTHSVVEPVVDRAEDHNRSVNASPIFTLFDVVETEQLTREHILQVAAGTVGAVVIRDFSSADVAADIMESIQTSAPLGHYDEALIWPQIAKLGPAAYDCYAAGELDEAYWETARQAVAMRSTLMYGSDPLDFAFGRVAEAWGDAVIPARSRGSEMFAGMIREIHSGAKIHFDEIVREFPGVLDETPASFVTMNWFLSTTESGGETTVYRHRWRPLDEAHRDGYGYDPIVVDGELSATALARPGDAMIFDSRNLHSVAPVSGSGRRVTLSYFLGIAGHGPLLSWS
jgi:hypothetical protein